MTVAVFAAALALLGCGQECGGGTIEQDGKCVPSYEEVTCAPGTRLSPAGCVPDLATLCGAGTIASLGRCLPASVLVCGPGTQQIEDSCVPKEASLTCGEGTVVRDGVCVSLATVPVLLPFAAGTSVPVYLEPAIFASLPTLVDLGLRVSYYHGLQKAVSAYRYVYINPTLGKTLALTDTVSLALSGSLGYKFFTDRSTPTAKFNTLDALVSTALLITVAGPFYVKPSVSWAWTNFPDRSTSDEMVVFGGVNLGVNL